MPPYSRCPTAIFPETINALRGIFLAACLLSTTIRAEAASPDWTVNPAGYQYNMNMVIRVSYNQAPSNNPDNLVGVFVGTELRGVAAATDIGGEMYYFATVYSNQYAGETLRFRAFYAPDDEVYASVVSISFLHNGAVSSLGTPFWIDIDPNLDFAPEILPIPADTTLQSLAFDPVNLEAAYLLSLDGDPVTWSATAGPNLSAAVVNGVLTAAPVSPSWTGTDTVTITATESTPNHYIFIRKASFTVLPDYGPPVFQPIPAQTIYPGEAFAPFDLDNALAFAGPCRAFNFEVFPYTGTAPDPAWPAIAPGPQPMTVVARVLFADQALAGPGAQLAAFVNNVLVGTAAPAGTPPKVSYSLALQNLAAGPITFRLYHAENQYLYEKTTNLSFTPGGSAGSVANPYLIQLAPLLPTLAPDGAVQVSVVDSAWLGAFPVDFIVWDCHFPAVRRDTVSTTFSVVVDNRPRLTSPATASFQENACTPLYDAQATDPQDTEGNGLMYSIAGGDDAGKFAIDATTGQLSWFNFTPDFESPADDNTDNQYVVLIRVTNSMLFTDELTLTITVTDSPTEAFLPQINGGAPAACLVGSVTLQASGGITYLWNDGNPSPSIVVTATGTYTVTVTGTGGCVGTASVSVSTQPTVTATGSATPVCLGSGINLNATPAGGSGVYTQFAWAGPNGFSATAEDPAPFAATAAAAGTYTVTVTDNAGCTATATTTIAVSANPAPAVVATNTGPVCNGATLTLHATPTGGSGNYAQYRWAGPNAYLSPLQNPLALVATPAVAGTYTVTVTDNAGCTATGTTAVQVKALPAIAAVANGPLCTGATVQLSSTPSGGSGAGYTFQWTGPNSYSASVEDPAGFAATLAASGTYTVTVTDNAGCTGAHSVAVSVTGQPSITAAVVGPTCTGGSLTLVSTPAGGSGIYTAFAWTGPNAFSANVEDPTSFPAIAAAAGAYTVTVTDQANCSATASATITVFPAPGLSATGNTPVCEGVNLTLGSTPSGGSGVYSSFNWTGPDNYVAFAEDPSGFSATLASAGVYHVKVTDSRGCTATATATVAVHPKPGITATSNSPVCAGANIDLASTPTGGGIYTSFSWTGPSGYAATQEDPPGFTATQAYTGIYQVTVTDNAGCTATATTSVNISTNGAPTITAANNGPLCAGAVLQLSSTPSGGTGVYTQYQWAGPNGYAAATRNPAGFVATGLSAGVYTVTVTDNANCRGTNSMTVAVSAPMAAPATSGLICLGSTIQLSAVPSGGVGGYTAFAWSGPNGFSAAAENPPGFTAVLASFGIYTVTVTDNTGCTGTGTVNVALQNNAPPTITCPANQNITAGAACSVSVGNWVSFATNVTDDCTAPGAIMVTQLPAAATLLSGHNTEQNVTLTADDGTGNTTPCTFKVTVKDQTPPSVTCPGNLTVAASINVPCSAVVSGIDAGFSDNCTGATLAYSRSGASSGGGNGQASGQTFLTGATQLTYTVTDAVGLSASCSLTVTVGACNTSTQFSGTVLWEHDGISGVQTATVNLTGSATGSAVTGANGDYLISLPYMTGNFTLKPVKNINKLNGVTTADAQAIQQHVGNIALLPGPFKRIAADVNKTNSITNLDATLVTQALLGSTSALSQITSWRFVTASYIFPNPAIPWGFPEQIDLTGVGGLVNGQNFKGIKLGDVIATWADPANFGTNEPMVLRTQDRVLKTGETVTVEFAADQLDDLNSFQFALHFEPGQLQLTDIEPVSAGLPISMDNFGTYNIAEGEIRVVWIPVKSVLLADATPVFRLHFTALKSGARLSDVLQLNDDILPGYSYNSVFAESRVELRYAPLTGTGNADPEASGSAALLDVRPNPFTETTTLQFVLPEAGEAELRISDASGRLLFFQKKHYTAGQQQEILRLEGVIGVLFAELVTEQGSVVRKMLAVKN